MKRKFFLNNYKINKKLGLIFVFCVIIPLIFTNGLVLFFVERYSDGEKKASYDKQMDAVENSLTTAITACMSAANDMYRDKSISQLLEAKYTTRQEYISKYNDIVSNNLHHYYYGSFMLSKITVYGDNESLTDGGYVYKVSNIRYTDWYKELQKMNSNNQTILIYTEYDNSVIDAKKKISIIRRLDYFNKSTGCEKIVKIDVDYLSLQKTLANLDSIGHIYVCEGDKIIIDNQHSNTEADDFESLSSINIKDASRHRKLKESLNNWELYMFVDESSIFRELFKEWELYLLLIVVNLLFPTIVIRLIGKSFTSRIQVIEEKMESVKDEQFEVVDIDAGKDEIGDLVSTYNRMVNKIKQLIEVVYKEKVEKKDLALAKKEAELTALHAQIDPHFLFNILENIRMRSLIKGEEETAEIIGELAIMMRKSCDWGKDMITVEEEITFARAYLMLQQYRFGDKLSFEFDIAPEYQKLKIPKVTIVTFVENAVVHGIEKVTRNGKISVSVKEEGRDVVITIKDTGQGMSKEILEGIREKIYKKSIGSLNDAESIGMLNSYHRLLLNFGDGLGFEIYSEENVGTTIIIKINKDACKFKR